MIYFLKKIKLIFSFIDDINVRVNELFMFFGNLWWFGLLGIENDIIYKM